MKRLLLIIAILSSSNVLLAQMTGGGGESNPNNTQNPTKQKTKTRTDFSNVFRNYGYFVWDRGVATGDFGKKATNGDDVYSLNYGNMSTSFDFEIGGVAYFKKIDYSKFNLDKFKLGFDYAFNIGYTFDNKTGTDIDANWTDSYIEGGMFNMGSKFGAVVSYNPWSRLMLDAKFGFNPSLMSYVTYIGNYSNYSGINPDYVKFDNNGPTFANVKYFSLDARFSRILFGLEWQWANITFKDTEITYIYQQNSETVKDVITIPYSKTNIKLGFIF